MEQALPSPCPLLIMWSVVDYGCIRETVVFVLFEYDLENVNDAIDGPEY